jgi:hypothetical protein
VVAGTCTAAEACRALGVGRTQLYELRARVLQAALAALEPRRRGRPPRKPLDPEAAAAEITRLRERVEALERELGLARAQAMVAGLLSGNARGSSRA